MPSLTTVQHPLLSLRHLGPLHIPTHHHIPNPRETRSCPTSPSNLPGQTCTPHPCISSLRIQQKVHNPPQNTVGIPTLSIPITLLRSTNRIHRYVGRALPATRPKHHVRSEPIGRHPKCLASRGSSTRRKKQKDALFCPGEIPKTK